MAPDMKQMPAYFLNLLWLIVSTMLIVGVSQPMFTFTHFYFFDDTFSLMSGIFHLLEQGEVILFGLLFCFSLLMPTIKMLLLLATINAVTVVKHQRYLKSLGVLGKWSMLDVFVIAILAVTIKISLVAEVTVHYGLIVFALGVVASMILPQLVSTKTNQQRFTNHQKIPLSHEQLGELVTQKMLIISNKTALEDKELVDIFDQADRWLAKAQVDALADDKATLELVALSIAYQNNGLIRVLAADKNPY